MIIIENESIQHTCCFFGHRCIEDSEELRNRLYRITEELIVKEKADTFLFGSRSAFNSLCLDTVTELKEKYPHIQRIYVRAEYQIIDDWYKTHYLNNYDDTYYPKQIENSGKAAYVERNREMIDKSEFCIVYYNEKYLPPRRKNSSRSLTDYQPKSGTALAYGYAVKKKKKICNIFP